MLRYLTAPAWWEMKSFYSAVLRSLTLKAIIVCMSTPNNALAATNDRKLIIRCTRNMFRHSPKSIFTLFSFTRNFEAMPKNSHFCIFSSRNRWRKISGKYMMHFKGIILDQFRLPANTIRVFSGVHLHIVFMSVLKNSVVALSSLYIKAYNASCILWKLLHSINIYI